MEYSFSDIEFALDDLRPFIVSLALVFGILFLRSIIIRLIRKGEETLSAEKLRSISLVRNLSVMLILISLAIMWSPTLSNIALSIAAFAVAIVIATKELILCLSGATWRMIARPFDVGDWVEIGGERGEVLELNLLSVHLAELDPDDSTFSGRTLIIPNSNLFHGNVRNENLWRRYTHHSFKLVAEYGTDLLAIAKPLEPQVEERCREFREVAERYLGSIRRRTGVNLPPSDPRVELGTMADAHPVITVHIFCPVERIHELQKEITEDFFKLTRVHGPPPVGEQIANTLNSN